MAIEKSTLAGTSFQGPVTVHASPDTVLEAEAVLSECGGYWGGFLKMASVAGAELVQEASRLHRRISLTGEPGMDFTCQRTHPESPVLRITGRGGCSFGPGASSSEPVDLYHGRARVVMTGAILVCEASLISWEEGNLSRWGGFLKMRAESMARLVAWEEAPQIELGDGLFPFTAVLREGEEQLRITGQGPAPVFRREDG